MNLKQFSRAERKRVLLPVVVDLRKQGQTISQICLKLKREKTPLSRHTVWAWLHESEVKS